jgi:acyl-CoA thioesterase
MVFGFDRATSAERTGDGHWKLDIDAGWNIRSYPNGGYLVASMIRPLMAELDKPDPLTVSAHFLRPTSVGSADLSTEVVKTGRTHTHVQASLVQTTERVRLLAAFGDLDAADGPTLISGEPPELPPPDQCLGRGQLPRFLTSIEITEQIDTRLAPDAPWLATRPAAPSISGWVRLADGRPPDIASLFVFADPFPPAVLALGPAQWVPTVELTVHIRARPTPGWLRVRFATRYLVDGYHEQDGELWDDKGVLVAQSRQLAMLRPRV